MKFTFKAAIVFLVVISISSGFAQGETSSGDKEINSNTPSSLASAYTALTREIFQVVEESSIQKGALLRLSSEDIQRKVINVLDPKKIYFTQEDLKRLKTMRPISFEGVKNGELNGLFDIYDLYKKYALLKNTFSTSTLKLGSENLDIYKGKSIVLPFADWAENKQEREERWSLLLAEDYLQLVTQQQNKEKIVDKLKERYRIEEQLLAEETPAISYRVAINALLSLYDERTYYIGPPDKENFDASFNLVGIGIEFNIQDGFPTVIQSVDGAPAHGKLFPGDKILALSNDNQQFTELYHVSMARTFRLLKGQKGSNVYLKILPYSSPSVPITVELTRAELSLNDQAVSFERQLIARAGKNISIGILRVPSFYVDFAAMQKGDHNYRSATRDAWMQLQNQSNNKVDGLVIDLRENRGGGYLEAAQFASLFISKGPASHYVDKDGHIFTQEIQPKKWTFEKPVTVLVNRQTAGSAELFAGAIKHHHRGVVVGEQTFGMGKLAQMRALKQGSLSVSVAKLYTSQGDYIDDIGVLPDIKFPTAHAKPVVSSPKVSVSFKTKKENYPLEELRTQHFQRIVNYPVFSFFVEHQDQLGLSSKNVGPLDLNARIKIAEQNRVLVESFARENFKAESEIASLLRRAELDESVQILADIIEN